MATTRPTVGEILKALPSLSAAERMKLLDGLCQYSDLAEDLRDVMIIIERRGEPTRPYEEFAEELKVEGRL